MTYAYSGALQEAVYARLVADTALNALVGGADFSTKTSYGGVHTFSVLIHAAEEGFESVKAAGKAVCEALIDAPLTLSEGVLVGLHFVLARADRGDLPARRTVTLQFRAVVDQA